MPTPVAVLTSKTATGDTLTGPGCPTVLIKNKPVATLGTAVAGSACTGTAIGNPNPKILLKNKPVLHQTSTVNGVNPATGAPVTTPVAQTSATKVIA